MGVDYCHSLPNHWRDSWHRDYRQEELWSRHWHHRDFTLLMDILGKFLGGFPIRIELTPYEK